MEIVKELSMYNKEIWENPVVSLQIELDNGQVLDNKNDDVIASYHLVDNIIFIHKDLMNDNEKQNEITAFFVHELIHFFDYIKIIPNSSDLNIINKKILETGFKFQINYELFVNTFLKISDLTIHNYSDIIFDIDVLKFIEDRYSDESIHKEMRAYIGQFLYWAEIEG